MYIYLCIYIYMYYVYNIHNIIYKYNFGKRGKKLEQQMIYVQDTQKNTPTICDN